MSNLSTLLDRYKALVVFDTETSGLDFDNDQIIELAALRVERTATGGLPTRSFRPRECSRPRRPARSPN